MDIIALLLRFISQESEKAKNSRASKPRASDGKSSALSITLTYPLC